jgi:hypothetical protein
MIQALYAHMNNKRKKKTKKKKKSKKEKKKFIQVMATLLTM